MYNSQYKEFLKEEYTINFDDAIRIGNSIDIDWSKYNLEEFTKGLSVELEHGDSQPETDVIPDINGHDDMRIVAKIVMAHLNEMPDYYTQLAKIEEMTEDLTGSSIDASNRPENVLATVRIAPANLSRRPMPMHSVPKKLKGQKSEYNDY